MWWGETIWERRRQKAKGERHNLVVLSRKRWVQILANVTQLLDSHNVQPTKKSYNAKTSMSLFLKHY